jgi:hypothetical protein
MITNLVPPHVQGGTCEEASFTMSLRQRVPRLGDLRRLRAFLVVDGRLRLPLLGSRECDFRFLMMLLLSVYVAYGVFNSSF